uniref:type II secretion system F family protein n=1 Tax=Vaginimicrobium propionicum TaxID=1871034 RepID=UPI0009713248|nr:hypothetical protein [Vaginimicrobium propionicum]
MFAWLAAGFVGFTVWLTGHANASRSANLRLSGKIAKPLSRKFRLIMLMVGINAVVAAINLSLWWVSASVSILIGLASWLLVAGRAKRRSDQMAKQLMRGCNILAGQLRAGKIPAAALGVAAGECEALKSVDSARQVGADVPAAMRRLAKEDGASGLRQLAAAWQLCELTGAPVAPAVLRVVDGLRTSQATERTVNAELASARATGRLLACLPLLGIALGYVAGGDPINFLVNNSVGNICLTVAIVLASLGLVWTEKLADCVAEE